MLATLPLYNKIILQTITTKPPVTIINFDIWNFIYVMSAIGTIQCCLHRCGESFLYDGLWRHKLPWRHICNKPIRVRENVLFTDIETVKKFRSNTLILITYWSTLVSWIIRPTISIKYDSAIRKESWHNIETRWYVQIANLRILDKNWYLQISDLKMCAKTDTFRSAIWALQG